MAKLIGRFSFRSWATGGMLVPEDALSFLAVEGVPFHVEGPATYEDYAPTLEGASRDAVRS